MYSILQHTASYCNTLQHTATHCNTLQHTATFPQSQLEIPCTVYCNTLHHTATHCRDSMYSILQNTATHCNTLQHTASYCNTLQHTATHCNTLQHALHSIRSRIRSDFNIWMSRCISFPSFERRLKTRWIFWQSLLF